MGPAERVLRKVVLGATATRTVRHSKCPVLVVRAAADAPYRRAVLAIDFDDSAREVLTFAHRVFDAREMSIAVVHVYDAPFQGLIYPSSPEDAIHAYRDECRQRAERKLLDLRAETGVVDDRRWWRHVRYGEPRQVVPTMTAQLGADLVVLGSHARSIVGHALLGSVAADVLDRVHCDVLIVPPAKGRRDAR